MSLPEFTAIFGSPLFGLFFDHYGHRSLMIALSGGFTIGGHLLLAFTDITPYVGMLMLGLSFSIFGSAIWTFIPKLVKPYQIATAYGIMTAAMNLALFLFPLVIATIQTNSTRGNFTNSQVFFMFLASISIIFCYLLHHRHKRVLHGAHSSPQNSAVGPGLPQNDFDSHDETLSNAGNLSFKKLSFESLSSAQTNHIV